MARNNKFDDSEDEDEGTDWASIAIGTVIGVGIGGLLGLLLAPKSGAETRADLNHQMDDLRDRAEEALDKLQDATADLRDNFENAVSAGKDAYAAKREELMAQLEP
jgi:gas vesicle protein